MVAAGRGGRVRPVAAIIARGKKFPREFGGDAGVSTPTRVKMLRRDELLVAHACIPGAVVAVTAFTLAVEAGELLKDEIPVRVAIAEALAFGPDAGIHHTNDDSLASAGSLFASQTAELTPKAVRGIQTEERRGAGSIQPQGFIFVHSHDPSLFRESCSLLRGDFGGKPVEGESVRIQLL